MPGGSYDSQSSDAMFSRVIERLDQQDRDSKLARESMTDLLTEIRAETRKTNGRVTSLEQWRATQKAKQAAIISIAAIGTTFVGWVVEHFFFK